MENPLPNVPFTLLFNCSLRILLSSWSSLRVAGFSPTFLVPHGLEQDKCSPCFLFLVPNHCPTFLHRSIQIWNSTSDDIISHFPLGNHLLTQHHFSWLPVSVSITMLIISLTISISYLAKSSSTLAFQFLDLLSSKHLILHLTSAIDPHGHTHMFLSLLKILFPSES